jgi:hypothetical protein
VSVLDEILQTVTAIAAAAAAYLASRNAGKLNDVHNAVNSSADAATARTEQLTATLTAAGVPVPATVGDPLTPSERELLDGLLLRLARAGATPPDAPPNSAPST